MFYLPWWSLISWCDTLKITASGNDAVEITWQHVGVPPSGKVTPPLTANKTHHVITILCSENLHLEVNIYVTL